jgi:CRP/FNR family transcriptional regulator
MRMTPLGSRRDGCADVRAIWTPAKVTLRGLLCRHADELGLTATAVDQIVARSTITDWKADQRIVGPPDRQDLVYFLVVGAVRIELPHASRGPMTVQILRPGQFLGLASLFEHASSTPFAATAHVPSHVALLSRGAMSDILDKLPPGRALTLMAHDERLMRRLLHRKCRFLFAPLHERLLHELVVLARDFGRMHSDGTMIDLPLTHADLSRLAVATRANVTRALLRLRATGSIRVEQQRIVLCGDPCVAETEPPASSAPARVAS